MSASPSILLWDNVRVRLTPETKARGVAGFLGQVLGETMPSVTGVAVIGKVNQDYALNVYFKERAESLWFAPELLELVDHAPGTEISLAGSSKKWARTATGDWTEIHDSKPWWRFW